jgi:aspartyl protease family protein
MIRHSIAVVAVLACATATATEVALIGTFESKAAILSIDAGAPKTLRPGQNFGGVTLISVDKDSATVDVDGKRRVLKRGHTYGGNAASGAQSVTLSAVAGGHFMADGQINGAAVRFLVDTGATMVALPASEASRLRIDYRNGQRGSAQTAAGVTDMYVVRLNSVRVGEIELQNIEALVIEKGLEMPLLGNSFLSRTEMRQEGRTMTLIRRY